MISSNIRVPEDLWDKLRKLAEKDKISIKKAT